MDTTDETQTVKETREEENPGRDNRTVLKEDPAKEFQEYLLDIGVRI